DEIDELLDLLVVERSAIGRAPRGHRDRRWRLCAPALDRERDQVGRRLERRRIVLDVLVLELWPVQGEPGQAGLVRIGAPQTGLAVTVEAKVRVKVAAALD